MECVIQIDGAKLLSSSVSMIFDICDSGQIGVYGVARLVGWLSSLRNHGYFRYSPDV